jgi:hypothetical protein
MCSAPELPLPLPFPIPAAILSDLDGVLVDSGDSIEVTWSAWARSQGIDPTMLHGRIHGRPAADVIREVAPRLDAVAEAAVVSQMDIDGPPGHMNARNWARPTPSPGRSPKRSRCSA